MIHPTYTFNKILKLFCQTEQPSEREQGHYYTEKALLLKSCYIFQLNSFFDNILDDDHLSHLFLDHLCSVFYLSTIIT